MYNYLEEETTVKLYICMAVHVYVHVHMHA